MGARRCIVDVLIANRRLGDVVCAQRFAPNVLRPTFCAQRFAPNVKQTPVLDIF
jgi:hypothetical protein